MSAAESLDDAILDDLADVDPIPLDVYMLEDEPEFSDEVLRDEAEVDTKLYIVHRLEEKRDARAALFDADIAKAEKVVADLRERKAQALKPFDSSIEFYGHQIEGWTRANISEDAKRKTIDLPWGSVKLRKQQESVKTYGRPSDHVPAELTRPTWATVTDIQKHAKCGPEYDLDKLPDGYKLREGFTPHKVMVGDQVVPGAVWEKPEQDRFEFKAGA